MDNGFDVVWVATRPNQLIMPASKDGSQKVAQEVLNFLLAEKNRCYQNMMLHSFSMGGYQWAECLVKMRDDPKKYEHVEKIMKAQVSLYPYLKVDTEKSLITSTSYRTSAY